MAGNAVYDANAPGVDNPQLEVMRGQMQADDARQQVLNTQGTMIAPAPMEMTPEEKVLSLEKQNGTYNPGGDVEMAANTAEGQLAANAYPQPVSPEEQISMSSQLDPNNDFLDASLAIQQKGIEQKKLDMMAPLYAKMKAQSDLGEAANVLESKRQESISQKELLQQEQVKDYSQFKAKYDSTVNVKLAEIDNELKTVQEDAKLSRQSTSELFSQKSSGSKFAAGIAMVLGAAGGVLKGDGRNVGIEIIQNTLENERRQLISNYANSKEILELKRKNIDDYTEAMTKQMQVADKQKMLQLQVLSTKFEIAESQYRGTAAGLAAKDANAGIQMQINQMKQQQADSAAMNMYFGKGGSPDDMPLQAAAAYLGQKPGEVLKDRRERSVVLPGRQAPLYATDPGSANKAREIVGPSEIIQENLAEIAKIVQANPLAVKAGGLSKAGTQAQAAMGRITAAMKGLESLGALDNGVIALVDGIVTNPTKLINQADYKRIANDLKQGAHKRLESYGVRGYAIPNAQYNFKPASAGMVDAKFGKYLKQK